MARDNKKKIDKTYLDVERIHDRGVIHRDYLAHCLRWSHVVKSLSPTKPQTLLDAGCGILAPMAKVLYTNRYTKVKYLGIDYNDIKPDINFGKFDATFWPNVDLGSLSPDQYAQVQGLFGAPPDFIVSFEVAEHMTPDRCVLMLRNLFTLAGPNTTLMISTPCFNGKAAKNHINEWTYEGFGAVLEAVGFEIVDHYGTFASQHDYKKLIEASFGEAGVELFKTQSAYFDSNVLSLLWAPMFPQGSRNVIWKLKLPGLDGPETIFLPETDHALETWFDSLYDGELGQWAGEDEWERAGLILSGAEDALE